MKKLMRILTAVVLTALCTSCEWLKNDVPIYEEFNFPCCQMPSALVWNMYDDEVTLSLSVFPDAEFYEMYIYVVPIPETGEPDPETLFHEAMIPASAIPYKFTILEGLTYYVRIRALAPSQGKEPSKWKISSFRSNI